MQGLPAGGGAPASVDDLAFRIDRLAYRLEEGRQTHREALAALQQEKLEVQQALRGVYERDAVPPRDDTFIREVEWRIQGFSTVVQEKPRNQALWSDEFSIMGVPMQLEFFPQGRDTTETPGFCALFLWCPAGVKLCYQLRVGSHRGPPDVDEFAARMGHGHSNFCYLEAQRDTATDSLVVGVDILDFTVLSEPAPGLRIVNGGPQAALRREAAVLTQRGIDTVEWRIANARQRARDTPRGALICSPPISLAGVRQLHLEFYPNGVAVGAAREGCCGLFMRCPSGDRLTITLFVGSARKGPIETSFEGNAAKGLPEFCLLEDQCDGEDIVVGVVVQNPALQEEGRRAIELGP